MTVEVETRDGRMDRRDSGSPVRLGHRSTWKSCDAEIEAAAPCLLMLFDEGGMALAELASADDAGAPASSWEPVDLTAPDLSGLACTWFNELMRDAGHHRAELVDVAVDAVTTPADGSGESWRLQGRAGLRWLFGNRGPARHDLRATTEDLSVEAIGGNWRLRAHLEPVDASSSLDDDQRPKAGDPPQLTSRFGNPNDVGHVLVRKRGLLGEQARPLRANRDATDRELAGDVHAA